ncbi:MAG: UvrD-helicase domain-containing protein [Humibacillus sp.]|nr:UvrD-helicase domain-containing protein [Humibacillus sp.]MDN5776609.1 UvrD-helicase domain-containing protein [Humibacillus sp.]
MKGGENLRDRDARSRIRHDTASTLFVDAGAGSGKTSALVSRVQTLVVDDGIPIENIAAVTFTERAAAELRERLRERLEQQVQHTTRAEARTRAQDALDGLDLAAIGTLHAFAQRVLAQHPVEAGIPPLVEVLDEVASSVAFESRWAQIRTQLLDDEQLAPTLETAFALGVRLDHLRSLITRLNGDWDLVESHVLAGPAPGPPPTVDAAGLLARARDLVSQRDHCTDDDDKFLPVLAALESWVDKMNAAGSDLRQQISLLRGASQLRWGGGGKGANWGGRPRLDGIRNDCKAWQVEVARLVVTLTTAALRVIVRWCGERVLASAQERRAEGRLEFHDLLVLTRNLLRDNAEVRGALQERYQRLLLDEFQDTDPIQIEIAVRIAGGVGADAENWEDVAVPAGALFVVGDPKQSIYRFRRADIATYLRAQNVLGGQVTLTTNFRTGAPVLDWVNAVFADLIVADEGKQPDYVALDDHRGGASVGPPVAVVGAEAHDGLRAGEVRVQEAGDVARVIQTALAEGWTTEVESGRDEQGNALTEWRPLRPGDITILLPARTSLPYLEQALDEAGVLYRTESSSLVYAEQEVRDLFAAARAIADPSDAFALVTALRSALFGCGDDDLFTWKRDGGSFALLAPARDGAEEHPVGAAIGYLRRLHHTSRWRTPSEVLTRLAVDRRMFEAAVYSPRTRDSWRRLRYVIDQARAWSETEHGGLRAYLAWAAAQASEGSRAAEVVLPETDVDSVRIMTVHAAKGLEFPMVVLSGLSSLPYQPRGVRLLWKDRDFAVALGAGVETDDFAEQVPVDEQMSDYERMRLLYVAATRARDHLVVSLHRGTRGQSNATKLAGAGAATAADAVQLEWDDVIAARSRPATVVSPPPDFQGWLERVQASAAASRNIPVISASGLEGTDPDALVPAQGAVDTEESLPPGAAKGARDTEQPAWAKGRYGSAVGRAVHGVLQSIDLATGERLAQAAASQCLAEGVVAFEPLVVDLVRSALAAEVVQRAAVREHWRESYVGGVHADGILVEGYIDLLYREDDGSLVIVDYKTDDVPASALPARAAFYRPQLRTYEELLRSAGLTVSSSVLLFTTPTGATCLTV